MKSVVNDKAATVERKYPYLGICYNDRDDGDNWDVAFFYEKESGRIVAVGTGCADFDKIGSNVGWAEECYEIFRGSVTLSND